MLEPNAIALANRADPRVLPIYILIWNQKLFKILSECLSLKSVAFARDFLEETLDETLSNRP